MENEKSLNTNGTIINEIPKSIVNKFQISEILWEEKIKSCWSSHTGMIKWQILLFFYFFILNIYFLFREEAELEYLKLASTLEMYGVNYYKIKNKKGTQLWLGIDPFGKYGLKKQEQ